MAMQTFLHEQLYRGQVILKRLAATRITICGAGALGSNLADNLARQGASSLRVIDHDRIEQHNVGTQIYTQADVGAWKVEALRKHLFRATGIEIDAIRKELGEANARAVLKESELIIDCFDNRAARAVVQDFARATHVPALHVGLSADYCEVIWDGQYRVPEDAGGDVCEYPLARNIVLLAVVMASEAIIRFIESGERVNRSATLRDLTVGLLETA